MRKAIIYLCGLIIMGTVSYFGGYYYYTSSGPQTVITEKIAIPHTVQLSGTVQQKSSETYYSVRIEQKKLMVYKMPEEALYDSIDLETLQLTEREQQELLTGVEFQSFTEVLEFLENSMS